MRKVKILLACLLASCNYITVKGQITAANQLHCSRGFFGGFEAGSSNISKDGAGTDYKYILPNLGGFSVVKNSMDAKGIGVFKKAPRSGNYMMVAHYGAKANGNVWWKVLPVKPGLTYQFGAFITSVSKTRLRSWTVQLSVNDSIIATAGLTDNWGNIHGQFTAPPNVTSAKICISNVGLTEYGNYMGVDDIYFGRIDEKMFDDALKTNSERAVKPALSTRPASVAAAKTPLKVKSKMFSTPSLLRSPSKKPVITIFPNPARDYFVININSFVFETTLLRIVNQSGKVVLTRNAHLSVGLNAITISDRKSLSGGSYKVQLISGKDVCNHDLVVL